MTPVDMRARLIGVFDVEMPSSARTVDCEAAVEIARGMLAEWTVCLWLCSGRRA